MVEELVLEGSPQSVLTVENGSVRGDSDRHDPENIAERNAGQPDDGRDTEKISHKQMFDFPDLGNGRKRVH